MSRSSMCRFAFPWICVFSLIHFSIGFNPDMASRSLSSFSYMHYERCLRVKIRDSSDDDGNSYFYNGAYRSKGVMYLAYRLCSDSTCSDGGTSYLVDGSLVLDSTVAYTQDFCNSCKSQCSSNRNLADNAEQQNGNEIVANCKTCLNECKTIIKNTYQGEDETQYLQCQEAHVNDDGIQYYSNPACDNDGKLTIGLFYDKDCIVKRDDGSEYGSIFAKNTFHALQALSMDCASGICDTVEEDGLQCTDGSNFNENIEDDMGVCRAYKKVTKEWKYASPKRNTNTALLVTLAVFLGTFLFLSYSYFVRHKRAAAAAKAATEGTEGCAETEEHVKADYAELT